MHFLELTKGDLEEVFVTGIIREQERRRTPVVRLTDIAARNLITAGRRLRRGRGKVTFQVRVIRTRGVGSDDFRK